MFLGLSHFILLDQFQQLAVLFCIDPGSCLFLRFKGCSKGQNRQHTSIFSEINVSRHPLSNQHQWAALNHLTDSHVLFFLKLHFLLLNSENAQHFKISNMLGFDLN